MLMYAKTDFILDLTNWIDYNIIVRGKKPLDYEIETLEFSYATFRPIGEKYLDYEIEKICNTSKNVLSLFQR